MQFFRMQAPAYSSEKQDFSINGNLEYLYRFPGLSCDICKATYSGSRILTYEAPPQIQNDRRFRSRWPVSENEHQAMQQEVAGYLDADFAAFETFRPGDTFQPAFYDNRDIPRTDFLWPNIRSFVVSARMKRMIFDDLTAEVDIIPITLRKIGNAGGSSDSSEATAVQPTEKVAATEPYYQILVRAESDYPRGGHPVSVCRVCKHEIIDDATRELVMHKEMWRGQPIFLLRTTLYVLVTEALADRIRQTGASNVDFVPL